MRFLFPRATAGDVGMEGSSRKVSPTGCQNVREVILHMVGARDRYMFKTYHVKSFENQVNFVEEMP